MNPITAVMLVFSVIAAADRIFGNRLGLGKEFERGFNLLGTMALSMIGMIVISPYIADLLSPLFGFAADVLHMEPSVIPASLFANDMGGAPLAVEVARDDAMGKFNALVVSSMMGCTISFTVPVALTMVKRDFHREVLLGFLCGIVTIPVGCLVSGLVICRLPILPLALNLLPLTLFSALIGVGLFVFPDICVAVFAVIGRLIGVLITIGLVLGVVKYLSGIEVISGLATYEEAGLICLNASAVMSGAFPLMYVVSRLLKKPLGFLGRKLGISEGSAMGFVSTIATSVTTFEMMNTMDKKGIVLNSAFAISAAFTFAGHLAFTMAFDGDYIFAVIVGKLCAGIAAFALALIVARKQYGKKETNDGRQTEQ